LTGRNRAIDIAKALTITAVVAGHSIEGTSVLWRILSSFHVPLFFLLAGYLARGSFAETASNRARRLLIPYVYAGLTAFGVYMALKLSAGTRVDFPAFFKPFSLALLWGNGWNPPAWSIPVLSIDLSLWFLPCLFAACVLFAAVRVLPGKALRWAAALGLSVAGVYLSRVKGIVLPWSVDIAMAVQLFLLAGFELRNLRKDAAEPVSAILFPVFFILWTFTFRQQSAFLDLNTRAFGIPWHSALTALFGCGVILSLSALLARFAPAAAADRLEWLGRNSLVVLWAHALGTMVLEMAGIRPYSYLGLFLIQFGFSLAAARALGCWSWGRTIFGARP
jgi:fucose 4-O-acetylase-like acetyltransferase